jgi:hypothetical protein
MKTLMCLLACLVMVGCTQTMTMVHTQGMADDVVDETSSATATPTTTISPTLTIPAKVI